MILLFPGLPVKNRIIPINKFKNPCLRPILYLDYFQEESMKTLKDGLILMGLWVLALAIVFTVLAMTSMD